MFGWSISARACRSASNRAMHLAGVHPGLDDLQRDLAADRLVLLGHVDDAHAALADLLEQLVRPDPRPRPFRIGVSASAGDPRPGVDRASGRRFQEAAGLVVGLQQRARPVGAGRRRRRRPGPGRRPARPGRPVQGREEDRAFGSVMARSPVGRARDRRRRRPLYPQCDVRGGITPGNFREGPGLLGVDLAAEPGAGVGPVAGRRCEVDRPRTSAASARVSPAKYAELDQLGACRVRWRRAGRGPRRGRAGRRRSSGAAGWSASRSTRPPAAAVLEPVAGGGRSRRGCAAWPRPPRRRSGRGRPRAGRDRRRPAAGTPRGPGRWPGASARASRGPAAARPAGAARRRPGAAARRRPAARPSLREDAGHSG